MRIKQRHDDNNTSNNNIPFCFRDSVVIQRLNLQLRRLLADKFLQVAILRANAYQRTKFQLFSSISFGDMRGSQNKKWELLISPDAR